MATRIRNVVVRQWEQDVACYCSNAFQHSSNDWRSCTHMPCAIELPRKQSDVHLTTLWRQMANQILPVMANNTRPHHMTCCIRHLTLWYLRGAGAAKDLTSHHARDRYNPHDTHLVQHRREGQHEAALHGLACCLYAVGSQSQQQLDAPFAYTYLTLLKVKRVTTSVQHSLLIVN